MKRILALAVLVALAVTALSGCSGSKGKDKGDEADEPPPTAEVLGTGGPRDCDLTTVDEVRSIFGAPVGADLEGGRCRFEVPDGEVRFQIWTGPERLTELAPDGEVVPDLGTLALWAPATGTGGVLAVETATRRVVFEILLGGDQEIARTRGTDWARRVIGRLDEADQEDPPVTTTTDPQATTTLPPPPNACKLLDAAAIERLLGDPVEGVDGGGACDYSAPDGTILRVGPLDGPVTAGALDGLYRSTTVDGEPQVWAREDLDDLGDGAATLTDPESAGIVELYVVIGSDLLRVNVLGTDGEDSKALAIATATEVIRTR